MHIEGFRDSYCGWVKNYFNEHHTDLVWARPCPTQSLALSWARTKPNINSKVFLQTLNKLEYVHLLVIKRELYILTVWTSNISFYRTLNKLKHNFLNVEQTRTCSSVSNRTRTPYFCLRTNELRTSNIVRPITNL